jgi:hypothetical protein
MVGKNLSRTRSKVHSRNVMLFQEWHRHPLSRQSEGDPRKRSIKVVKKLFRQGTRAYALANRNCGRNSTGTDAPFTPSPQTARKRFESHLDYRSRPFGRDSSRLVVKVYLGWLVRVSAACL